jgi:hypothetical protein
MLLPNVMVDELPDTTVDGDAVAPPVISGNTVTVALKVVPSQVEAPCLYIKV